MTPRQLLRATAVTWWLHLKMMHRSAFEGLLQVLWPLFFATTALLMYRLGGDEKALVYAAIGAAVMSAWTAISSTGSALLHRERGLGTLELLVAAPTPFWSLLLSMISSVATVGAYGVVATLCYARLVFGVRMGIAAPVPFGLAVTATVVSFTVLGFLLAVTVVRYPAGWALGSLLEYPVWLLGGFLVPSSVLPQFMRSAAVLLPPSWGMSAVRKATDGLDPWRDLLVCTGLSALYALAGIALAGVVLRSARRNATLDLA